MSAIKQAAEILRREAESMKECHTVGVGGEWYGESAKAEYDEMIAAADAAIAERDALRAKIAEMEQQEPVATVIKEGDSRYWMSERLWTFPDGKYPLYALPGAQAQPAPSVPDGVAEALQRLIENGAVFGPASSEDALLVARYRQHLLSSAPSVPDGWLRAIDEALVTAHIGVANAHDTYEQAKAKLDNLIKFHVDVAIDPAVNGGYKLMPVEPTKEIYECFSAYDGTSYSNPFGFDEFSVDYAFALEAAPEAKP